jgi:hypothetical protein
MSLEQNFREQGFAVLPELITARELASIRRAARRIVDDFDIGRYQTVFSTSNQEHAEDSYFLESAEAVHCFLEEDALDARGRPHQPKELAINKLGHALHDLVPEFSDFCRLPQFREVLRTIGYDRALLWQTMYIFKQAGIGGEVRWHQDASYLITQPSSIVGFWVAMTQHPGQGKARRCPSKFRPAAWSYSATTCRITAQKTNRTHRDMLSPCTSPARIRPGPGRTGCKGTIWTRFLSDCGSLRSHVDCYRIFRYILCKEGSPAGAALVSIQESPFHKTEFKPLGTR